MGVCMVLSVLCFGRLIGERSRLLFLGEVLLTGLYIRDAVVNVRKYTYVVLAFAGGNLHATLM